METLANIFIWTVVVGMLIMVLVDLSTIIQGKHDKDTLNSLYQFSTILLLMAANVLFNFDSMFEAPYYLKVLIALVVVSTISSLKPFGKA